MPRERSLVNPAVVGIVAAAIMLVLLVVAFVNLNPFAHTITIHAQVASGDTLAPGADVEVAGVKIGSVKSIEKGSPGALLTMTVDTASAPVFKDASASVRPHGVFGPKFLEITPGTSGAGAVADGYTIPIDRTTVSVDFDQVLNELNTDTRKSLQTAFYELGVASTGRGQDFGQTLDNLQVVTVDLVPPLNAVGNRQTELGRFLENNATVQETFAASPLDSIIHENATVFTQLDRNRTQVADLVTHGNNVLGDLDTLTTGNVDPLRATVAKLPNLVDNLDQFNNLLGYGANWLAPVLTPSYGQAQSDVGLAIARTKDAFGQCDVSNQPGYDTLHATAIQIVPCLGADGRPYVDANGHVAHHHVNVLLGTHTGTPQGDQETGTHCSPDLRNPASHTAYTCIADSQSVVPVPPLPPDGIGFGPSTAAAASATGGLLTGLSPNDALTPQPPVTLLEVLLGF